MKRSDRARLLLKIVERLSQDEWPTIDLILGQFEGRRSDEWQGSRASYIGWSIENASDEAMQDLGDLLGLTGQAGNLGNHEIGLTEVSDVQRIWGANPSFRLFLSHVSKFKAEAAALKDALSLFGVTSFVAHADIQPTKEWLEEILRALRTSDALAALLVPEFHASNWTDQEIGYALGRNIPVIPLKYHQDPYGFIGRFQALNCTSLTPTQVASNIVRLLLENPASKGSMADALGRRLLTAVSYAHAKSLMDILEMPSALPKATLEMVAKAQIVNGQVQDAWGVPERIAALFERHGFLPQPANAIDNQPDEIPF